MGGSIPVVVAVIGGGVLVALLLRTLGRRAGGLSKPLAEAADTGEIGPLLAWLDSHDDEAQLTLFNKVIRRLWDDYHRETAARVVRELAVRHSEARITQYWLDQVQRVEPEIARDTFDRAFLDEHFRPEVAARCGQFG